MRSSPPFLLTITVVTSPTGETFMPVQIICPSCGTKLRVPSKLVRSGQAVKCPKCGIPVSMPVPASPASAKPEPVWYIAQNRQRLGPFSATQLQQLAQIGQLRATDMVFRDGTSRWVPASSVPGLFQTPPPGVSAEPRSPARGEPADAIPLPALQRRQDWFEMSPFLFEPDRFPCHRCGREVTWEADLANQVVSCPHCLIPFQMPMLNPQGARWENHSRQVKRMLDGWFQGGCSGDFPEGAFGELKRQHQSAVRKAQQFHDLLSQLKGDPQADARRVREARDQVLHWNGRQQELLAARRRAISQIKGRVRLNPTARPGSRWVFTDDDVRWVPEHLIPPPGSPDREGYEIIPGDEPAPTSQEDWAFDRGERDQQPPRATPKRGNARTLVWVAVALALMLVVVLPVVLGFLYVMLAPAPRSPDTGQGTTTTPGKKSPALEKEEARLRRLKELQQRIDKHQADLQGAIRDAEAASRAKVEHDEAWRATWGSRDDPPPADVFKRRLEQMRNDTDAIRQKTSKMLDMQREYDQLSKELRREQERLDNQN